MSTTDDEAAKEAFKEKLRSLTFGYTHGKSDFHGDTVRQRQRQQVEEATKAGLKIEPVGTRWV